MCSWRSCGNVLKKETRRRVWNAYKLQRLSLRRDKKNSLLRVSNLKNWQNYWYSFSLCCIYSLFRAVVLAFSASFTGDVTSEVAKDDWERGWDLTLYWMYCLQVKQLGKTVKNHCENVFPRNATNRGGNTRKYWREILFFIRSVGRFSIRNLQTFPEITKPRAGLRRKRGKRNFVTSS